jgi:hypothetical protein
MCGKRRTQHRDWPKERSSVFHTFTPAKAGVVLKSLCEGAWVSSWSDRPIRSDWVGRTIRFVQKRVLPWGRRRVDKSHLVYHRQPCLRGHHPFRPLAEIPSGLSRKDSLSRCRIGQFLRRCLVSPTEILFADPHAVQDDGQLAATAMRALLKPRLLAIFMPQARSVDHFLLVDSKMVAA